MKIKVTRDVYSSSGWRYAGDVVEMDSKTANHYINKGIGIEYKEEKQQKETKEAKTPRKRTTKKAK